MTAHSGRERELDLLAHTDLFASMDAAVRERVLDSVGRVSLADGQHVFNQGEESDSLYVAVSGRFQVYTTDRTTGATTAIQLLGSGDCFGEMGLITQEPRSASVRALGEGEVLRLNRAPFMELLANEPSAQRGLGTLLSNRLRVTNSALGERDRLLSRGIERALQALPFGRWKRVLEVSVLEPVTRRALESRFGPDAESVAEDLAALGVVMDYSSPALTFLRARLQEEVGPEPASVLARETGAWLVATQCWDEAISVYSRYGPPELLRTTLDAAAAATQPPDA